MVLPSFLRVAGATGMQEKGRICCIEKGGKIYGILICD